LADDRDVPDFEVDLAADDAGTDPSGLDISDIEAAGLDASEADSSGVSGAGTPEVPALDEDPPSYRSGRVRIIGAEPAGNAIHEVTGPVVEENPDMPHWNDAPTGQVPAILDRGNGDEQGLAPPSWREEETDWAAHEELFEPSMLSDEQPAVGSLMNNNNDLVDMERQPWRFDTADLPDDDETLVIEADFEPETVTVRVVPAAPLAASNAHTNSPPLASISSASVPSVTTGHDSRLVPPVPPQPRVRAPRTSRLSEETPQGQTGGTSGRNMQLAWGSGIVLGIAALVCAHFGNLASMVIISIVVLFGAAEGFAAFRVAKYHPATLLGLVAILSLLIETYNKGPSALPLVLVVLVAASFLWYLARVEPAADPVAGISSTIFVVVWIGGFGSFGALLLNPTLFPDRHGVAFLLAAVITTVAADVASLLVGSAFGRHPMAPSISPNKSWEGFLGGAVASILVAVIVVHFIHPWTIGKALVLGIVVAIVAPLGDLSQSMIKRNLGVKDMGRLMPGHGGILDRIDGLLFVLPATYFVVKAFHLG
jgi:phosphatidate cytidylyltransferase